MQLNRRAFLQTGVGGAAALAGPSLFGRAAQAADTIDVGVLFSPDRGPLHRREIAA